MDPGLCDEFRAPFEAAHCETPLSNPASGFAMAPPLTSSLPATAAGGPPAVQGRAAGELCEEFLGVNPQGMGDLDELQHVDPALAGLDVGDPGLRALQARGELALREACGFAGLDDDGTQGPVAGRSKMLQGGVPGSKGAHR